jgi:hypothetical protein
MTLDPQPKEPHEDINKSLYEQVGNFFGDSLKLKYDSKTWTIVGETTDFRLHVWISSVLHFVVEFRKRPDQKLIKGLDEFSGKVIAFTMSIPESKIESAEIEFDILYHLKNDPVSRFIVPSAVADFSSNLKTTVTPFFTAFLATIEDLETGVSIGEDPDNFFLSLHIDIDSKEPPWDCLTKYCEKINRIGDSVLQGLGAEIAAA